MSLITPRDTLVSATNGNIYRLDLVRGVVDTAPLLVGSLALDDIAVSRSGDLYGLADGRVYQLVPQGTSAGALYEPVLVAELPRPGDRYDFRGMDFSEEGDELLVSGNALRDIAGQATLGDAVLFAVDPASGAVSVAETVNDLTVEDFATAFDDFLFANASDGITLSTVDPLSVQDARNRQDFVTPASFEGFAFDVDRGLLFGFSGDNVYRSFYSLGFWEILENGSSGVSYSGAAYYRPTDDPASNDPPLLSDLDLAFTPGVFDSVPLRRLLEISDGDGLDDLYALRIRVVSEAESGIVEFDNGDREADWLYFPAQSFVSVAELLDEIRLIPLTNTAPVVFEVVASDRSGATASTLIDLSAVPLSFPSSLELEYFARETAYGSGPLATLGSTGAPGEVFAGWTVSKVFESGGFRAVALERPGYYPVLAVRGTVDHPLDWLANTDTRGPGFEEASRAWDADLSEWFRQNPYASITGHSQGGAQAQLFAALAVQSGYTVGKVHTFNSPGMEAAAAVSPDAPLWEVVHWVSSDDIVSQAGPAFLPGRVNYYDFSLEFDASVSTVDYLAVVTRAHTGHWAQAALYEAGPSSTAGFVGYFDTRDSLRYSTSVTNDAQIEAPEFSQLGADPNFDDEIGPTLVYADALIDIIDPRLANIRFLDSRAGTETLRTDWAAILEELYLALNDARDLGTGALSAVSAAYSGAENAISGFLARFRGAAESVVVETGTHAASTPAIVLPSAVADQIMAAPASSALYILGPGIEDVQLSDLGNIVAGGLSDLNGSEILNFTDDDQLIIFDILLDADMLTIDSGSAVLRIDQNRDGSTDSTIRLPGAFEPSAFNIDFLAQNTIISYAPPSASPILRAPTLDVSTSAGDYFAQTSERLRLTGDGDDIALGLVGAPPGSAVAQGRYGSLALDVADGSYVYTLDPLAAAAAQRPLSEVFIVTAREGGVTYSAPIVVAEVGSTDFSLEDPNGDNLLFDALLNVRNETVAPSEALQLFRTYSGVLGRTPDDGGFDWWFNQILLGNHDLRSMVEGFLWSDEFLGFFPSAASPTEISEEAFVLHMYRNVFDRDPDDGGFAFWTGELTSGSRSQADVIVDMTQSNEFVALTLSSAADYLI